MFGWGPKKKKSTHVLCAAGEVKRKTVHLFRREADVELNCVFDSFSPIFPDETFSNINILC